LPVVVEVVVVLDVVVGGGSVVGGGGVVGRLVQFVNSTWHSLMPGRVGGGQKQPALHEPRWRSHFVPLHFHLQFLPHGPVVVLVEVVELRHGLGVVFPGVPQLVVVVSQSRLGGVDGDSQRQSASLIGYAQYVAQFQPVRYQPPFQAIKLQSPPQRQSGG
jgi:hypothetical protein